MTIYKSRQVNLDPEPWECPSCGERHSDPDVLREFDGTEPLWSPRPEFEPTRDRFPWEIYYNGTPSGRHVAFPIAAHYELGDKMRMMSTEWAPRREQFDTPVNPILEVARQRISDGDMTLLDVIEAVDFAAQDRFEDEFTPEQIDHARRVLTRLAEWSPA